MPTTAFRFLLLFSLAIANGSSYAASAHEQDQLSRVQQQLEIIERLTARAMTDNTAAPDDLYRFDYPRLSRDIQHIRDGIQGYLSLPAHNLATLVSWWVITVSTLRLRSPRHEHD